MALAALFEPGLTALFVVIAVVSWTAVAARRAQRGVVVANA